MTRIATALSPNVATRPSLPWRRASGALPACFVALLACGLLSLVVACKSKSSTSPDASTGPSCAPNIASSSGTATKLSSTQSVEDKICFEGSSKWYVINVPSGNTLLDVTAGYPPASNTTVQLDLKVYYQTNSTTLTLVQDLVAPTQTDGGVASIQTTLHALQSGSYYVQAGDAHNVNFDSTNAYTLTVGYAVDPDSHEPNDTTADAKPSDSKPGYLAYLNDLDVFKTSVAAASDLLTLSITNPKSAPAAIDYKFTSSDGTVLGEGQAPAQTAPLSTQLMVKAAGTYYVTLSYPAGTIPSRSSSAAYSLSFGSTTNPDTVNNHTIATAVCPGGGSGPCTMAFSGTSVTLPTQTSYISVPGQRDYYRVDVTSGAALVLQIELTSAASTSVKYAVDLLTADPSSACQADTDCVALNQPCTYAVNDAGTSTTTDCELSHACLPPGNYGFCPSSSTKCSLCQGAGLCIPSASGGGGFCAIPQYLSAFDPAGKLLGGSTVSTAQPLFSNATYYVNVHDASYRNTDLKNPYSLVLTMAPELDTYDQSTTAADRNNFYDPYPGAFSIETPNTARAVDITSQLKAGTPVTGYISYQADDDWFSFQHPCPGQNCALDFTWTQPGPSKVQVAFYMLDQDLTLHESFAYTGTPTTSLTAPVVSSFDNQSCSQCSFASATESDGGPYTYYLRIADVSQKNWDFSGSGQYSVTVTEGAVGCPAACSQGTSPAGCYCYCASQGACPSPNF